MNVVKKYSILLYYSAISVLKFAGLDQITKYLILRFLSDKPMHNYSITDFISLTATWNYGMSFGLFSNYNNIANGVFIILNSALVIFLWSSLLKTTNYQSYSGYVMIIGGAVGNIIDRFFYGAVFDFLHFHIYSISFPIFNLADSFISIGVIIVLYGSHKHQKTQQQHIHKI